MTKPSLERIYALGMKVSTDFYRQQIILLATQMTILPLEKKSYHPRLDVVVKKFDVWYETLTVILDLRATSA